MARLILGVTGSVAAMRTPALYAALREAGHVVRVVATDPSLHFFDPNAARARTASATEPQVLCRDADEWTGSGPVDWRRGDPVMHIELRQWADLLIVAPLDANTLAKFALGLSDNLLSCLFRAWDFTRPVVLAPAMNTLMWHSPVTLRHLRQLLADRAAARTSYLDAWTLDDADQVFARHAPGIGSSRPRPSAWRAATLASVPWPRSPPSPRLSGGSSAWLPLSERETEDEAGADRETDPHRAAIRNASTELRRDDRHSFQPSSFGAAGRVRSYRPVEFVRAVGRVRLCRRSSSFVPSAEFVCTGVEFVRTAGRVRSYRPVEFVRAVGRVRLYCRLGAGSGGTFAQIVTTPTFVMEFADCQ